MGQATWLLCDDGYLAVDRILGRAPEMAVKEANKAVDRAAVQYPQLALRLHKL